MVGLPGNGRQVTTHRVTRRTHSRGSNEHSEVAYGRSGMNPRREKLLLLASCSIGCSNSVGRSPTPSAKRGVHGGSARSVRFVQQPPSALMRSYAWSLSRSYGSQPPARTCPLAVSRVRGGKRGARSRSARGSRFSHRSGGWLCRRNGEIFYASLCVYADVVITIVGNECDPWQTNVQNSRLDQRGMRRPKLRKAIKSEKTAARCRARRCRPRPGHHGRIQGPQ
jgi:hypothetical protein